MKHIISDKEIDPRYGNLKFCSVCNEGLKPDEINTECRGTPYFFTSFPFIEMKINGENGGKIWPQKK